MRDAVAGAGTFRWLLLPFQQKLEWERDGARTRLAQALRALRESDRQRHELQAKREAECASAAASKGQSLDPARRRHTLGYLSALEARMRGLAQVHDGLQARVAQARDACAACERRLDAVERAREGAQRAYQCAADLRADRAADDGWLLHTRRQPAGEDSA
jgi:flagellar biosynthesis chaperone FliJ